MMDSPSYYCCLRLRILAFVIGVLFLSIQAALLILVCVLTADLESHVENLLDFVSSHLEQDLSDVKRVVVRVMT